MDNLKALGGSKRWGRPKTNAIALHSQDLKEQVLELRKQKYTYLKIGEYLRISKTRAYQIVKEALDIAAGRLKASATDILEVELEHLEDIERTLYSNFERTSDIKIASILLRIVDQRARLLGHYKIPATVSPDERTIKYYVNISPDDLPEPKARY